MCHTVLRNDRENLLEVNITQQYRFTPTKQSNDTPTTARNMKQRHTNQVDSIGIKIQRCKAVAHHRNQIVVGRFNPLRQPGSTRGIKLITRFFRRNRHVWISLRFTRNPLLIGLVTRVTRIAQYDDIVRAMLL